MILKQIIVIYLLFSGLFTRQIEIPFHRVESQVHKTEEAFFRELGESEPIDITGTSLHHFIVELCIGSKNSCLDAKLATSYPYVWVVDNSRHENGFDPEKSKTFEETTKKMQVPELYGYVKGKIVKDTVRVGDLEVKEFPFILSNSELKYDDYQGAIGFGYHYDDKQYSFIDQLHENTSIENKIFYIKYNEKNEEGKIVIGEYPKSIRGVKVNFGYKTCDLLEKTNDNKPKPNNRWECSLKGIYYDTTDGSVAYQKIDSRISFNLSNNLLSTPVDFFDEFVKGYIQKEIDEGSCSISDTKYFKMVECRKNFDYKKLGSVSYMIGKWSLKFKAEDLFVPIGKILRLVIAAHKKLNAYILGYDMFKKYIVVFDKLKKQLGILQGDNE